MLRSTIARMFKAAKEYVQAHPEWTPETSRDSILAEVQKEMGDTRVGPDGFINADNFTDMVLMVLKHNVQ